MYFFYFKHPAPPEIYTLSLHAALPICAGDRGRRAAGVEGARPLARDPAQQCGQLGLAPDVGLAQQVPPPRAAALEADRKSTRLNSSHANISYAVFCLKKKILIAACISS